MAKMLISIPDELNDRMRESIPSGQLSEFTAKQIERGLDELNLRSLDDAIADIVQHDKPLLDRLGNVK